MIIDKNMGLWEIEEAGKLLIEYSKNQVISRDGLTVGFNPNSGMVYLYNSNDEYCAFNEDNEIEQYLTLNEVEGFLSDLIRDKDLYLLSQEDQELLEYYINN